MSNTEEKVIEVVLPHSGMFFRLRRPTFMDLISVRPDPNPMEIMAGFLHRCGTFDGKVLSTEEIKNMDINDAVVMINTFTANFSLKNLRGVS